jgi:hypothetical protein
MLNRCDLEQFGGSGTLALTDRIGAGLTETRRLAI